MRDRRFIVGEDTDTKFKKLEHTLRRFSRRLGKVVSFNVPPSIISIRVDIKEGRASAQFLIPVKGELKHGKVLFFGPRIDGGLIKLDIGKPGEMSVQRSMVLNKGTKAFTIPSIPCESDQVLTFSAELTYAKDAEVDLASYLLVALAHYAEPTMTQQNPYDIDMIMGKEPE